MIVEISDTNTTKETSFLFFSLSGTRKKGESTDGFSGMPMFQVFVSFSLSASAKFSL